MEMIILGWSIL